MSIDDARKALRALDRFKEWAYSADPTEAGTEGIHRDYDCIRAALQDGDTLNKGQSYARYIERPPLVITDDEEQRSDEAKDDLHCPCGKKRSACPCWQDGVEFGMAYEDPPMLRRESPRQTSEKAPRATGQTSTSPRAEAPKSPGSTSDTDSSGASDEARAKDWLDRYSVENVTGDERALVAILADVRRETIETCAIWIEQGPGRGKVERTLAHLLREEMAAPTKGAGRE